MKKVLLIAALICALACDEEETTEEGCLTGIPKSGGSRTLIKCSTREQYLAGDNTSQGGTASWTLYTSHEWEKCKECQ